MSYHIEINEYQRRLIMKALTSTDVNQFSQAPGSGDAFDTEAKEGQQQFGEQSLAQSLSAPNWRLWRKLMHQLRPLLLDQLSHIVEDF
jgi:hypothetical protein